MNEAYIELDKDRKSKITGIAFKSRHSEDETGKESASVTLKKLKFVNEKTSAPQKSTFIDKKEGVFNDSITALELSDKIGFGFSLGCGLNKCPFKNDSKSKYLGYGFQNNYKDDASANRWEIPLKMNLEDQETALGNQTGGMAFELCESPLVTKEFIDSVKEKGFKSIRIAATWFPHIIDKNYTIDPYFMERVKQVVDWAIAAGLYVLFNEHHSVHEYCPNPLKYADGYNLTEKDREESERYLKAIYTQICKTFNGSYDEHLIFETLNEPRIIQEDGTAVWAAMISDSELRTATKILNDYNQIIVDTIRASGGNNAKRFIMIPTYATDYSTVASEYLKLPEDTASGKLMVAIHWYPLGFNSESAKRTAYSKSMKTDFETAFKAAYDRFISKGVPVTMTEFGIENNDCNGTLKARTKWFASAESDREERLECLSDFCEAAGKYGVSVMAWDDGCVHSVVRRFAPYEAYDGDDFIKAMISSYEKVKINR